MYPVLLARGAPAHLKRPDNGRCGGPKSTQPARRLRNPFSSGTIVSQQIAWAAWVRVRCTRCANQLKQVLQYKRNQNALLTTRRIDATDFFHHRFCPCFRSWTAWAESLLAVGLDGLYMRIQAGSRTADIESARMAYICMSPYYRDVSRGHTDAME